MLQSFRFAEFSILLPCSDVAEFFPMLQSFRFAELSIFTFFPMLQSFRFVALKFPSVRW